MFTHSELGVQLVRATDDVTELLSSQWPDGRQQVLPSCCLSGGYYGNIQGLHRAQGRHVQDQGNVRAPPAGGGREASDEGATNLIKLNYITRI